MKAIDQLNKSDRDYFLSSITEIKKNIDFFVIRFYFHFLQTQSRLLFQNTKIQNQHKMFGNALDTILTQILDPISLENEVMDIVKTHEGYGIISNHVNDFIDSFMKALSETLPEEMYNKINNLWFEVMSEIMSYFRENQIE